MKYNLKATKIKLSAANKEYIQAKMDMLDKYLGRIKPIDCHVEVGLAVNGQKSGEIYRAEVVLQLPRMIITVEKVETDLLKAIDNVKEHVARSIVKHKEKIIDKRRGE
jgi:ribosomal subunit interface protein